MSVVQFRPWAPRKALQQRNLEATGGWPLHDRTTWGRTGASRGGWGEGTGVSRGQGTTGTGTSDSRLFFLVVRGAGRGARTKRVVEILARSVGRLRNKMNPGTASCGLVLREHRRSRGFRGGSSFMSRATAKLQMLKERQGCRSVEEPQRPGGRRQGARVARNRDLYVVHEVVVVHLVGEGAHPAGGNGTVDAGDGA